MTANRVYLTVGLCALIAYLGALGNAFAWDDTHIIVGNALVHAPSGMWRAFANPYWPPDWGGYLYRPLVIASYALDWAIDGARWFHAVNLLWHAAASVLVARLAWRWSGPSAALVAGVLFAVHPVHVEAVANVVGRAELMAACFSMLAVWVALERDQPVWSTALCLIGLLCKENAAVVPALIVTGWALGMARPTRNRVLVYLLCWAVAGAAYAMVRESVLQPFAAFREAAPVFVGHGPVAVRLTAVAALADVTRLLVFPLTLRADYSPAERTIVASPLDWRFAVGILCLVVWALLLAVAWRRGRKIEALGLAWVALSYAPVANLIFPAGVLIAERTLYLPSVGFALAIGAWARQLEGRRLWVLVGALAVLGGGWSAHRVPVWRNDRTVILSILDDSPRSYTGPMAVGSIYLTSRQPEKALAAFDSAAAIFPIEGRPYLLGGHAALMLKRYALADSLFARVDARCNPCGGLYRTEAGAALQMGDTAVADSLLAHARRLTAPPSRAGSSPNRK